MITLGEYISRQNISMKKLERMTGVSYNVLASNKNKLNPPVSLETIIKIYEGTKKEFGEGLACWEWTDLPKFWEK